MTKNVVVICGYFVSTGQMWFIYDGMKSFSAMLANLYQPETYFLGKFVKNIFFPFSMSSNSHNHRNNDGVDLVSVPKDVEFPRVFKNDQKLFWLRGYSHLKRVLYFHDTQKSTLWAVRSLIVSR